MLSEILILGSALFIMGTSIFLIIYFTRNDAKNLTEGAIARLNNKQKPILHTPPTPKKVYIQYLPVLSPIPMLFPIVKVASPDQHNHLVK